MFVITEKKKSVDENKTKALCCMDIAGYFVNRQFRTQHQPLLFTSYGWSLTFIIAYWLPTVADLISFGRALILR